MVTDLLNSYLKLAAHEIQFRLGYQTLIKKKYDWIETENESLSLSEWEDLKDLCLNSEEKMTLETKGHIRGSLNTISGVWLFSFVEWKENLKAHFSLAQKFSSVENIQNPLYWESLNLESGINFVCGTKQSGKSTLIADILQQIELSSPKQNVIHADSSFLSHQSNDKKYILGSEALSWSAHHPFYDGVDIIVCDFNEAVSLSTLEKWIHFSEMGNKVFISLSAADVETALLQLKSLCLNHQATWMRLSKQLKTILVQKRTKSNSSVFHEIIIFKNQGLQWLSQYQAQPNNFQNSHEGFSYQSLNQSIVQSLIKRKIDVKSAFEITDNPDGLDQLLKKMGL